jgi:hypothetical protein
MAGSSFRYAERSECFNRSQPGDAADPDLGAGCACAADARRQSLLVAQSPEEAEIQAFIDSVDEWPDAEPSQ